MTTRPQYAALPILAGPYHRRRLARFRSPVRHFVMITMMMVAIGASWALLL